jgi:hypothetical protein
MLVQFQHGLFFLKQKNMKKEMIKVYPPGTELFNVDKDGIRKFKVSIVVINYGNIIYQEANNSCVYYASNCVDTAEKATAKFLELLDDKI